MATLKEIYNALNAGENEVDYEVVDEIKLNLEVFDETAEEVEGDAKCVVTVNAEITTDVKRTSYSINSYRIYNIVIEKVVLHGVAMTYSEVKEKYGNECLGDDKHIIYEVRSALEAKYKNENMVFDVYKATVAE